MVVNIDTDSLPKRVVPCNIALVVDDSSLKEVVLPIFFGPKDVYQSTDLQHAGVYDSEAHYLVQTGQAVAVEAPIPKEMGGSPGRARYARMKLDAEQRVGF